VKHQIVARLDETVMALPAAFCGRKMGRMYGRMRPCAPGFVHGRDALGAERGDHFRAAGRIRRTIVGVIRDVSSLTYLGWRDSSVDPRVDTPGVALEDPLLLLAAQRGHGIDVPLRIVE